MYALRTLGTAAVGIALFAVLLSGCAVALEGVDSTLAAQGAVVAFVMLVIGLVSCIIAWRIPRFRGAVLTPDPSCTPPPALRYTIIIPIFNRPGYLVRLHRRIEEHLPAWRNLGEGEIIVINDGSTDETLAVAHRIAQRSLIPMRVFTQPNKGVSGARNRGFWEAKGRIGLVIDSDCLPDEDWLPGMIEEIERGKPSIVFATIYGDRQARFPLEASPAGAPYAGASFAIEVELYVALGGNFEGFSGASRDDGDLYLQSRRFGLRVVRTDRAHVWHPLRRQTIKSAFKSGLAHRYDNLLMARHGDAALFYMGDWILGGSFVGHYPVSLMIYAFVLLALYNAWGAFVGATSFDGLALATLFLFLVSIWLAAIVTFAALLRLERNQWINYICLSCVYATGSFIGRLHGTIKTGMPFV